MNNPQDESSSSTIYTKSMIAWIIATFILTPLVAVLLSIWNYIPFDPLTSFASALVVAFVYVGFRIVNTQRSAQV